ncbi:MAG: DNA polymerase IV, partial [Nitrospirae bacterium]|nr:DNA polymerase IV [Nitrospirota bacterium]
AVGSVWGIGANTAALLNKHGIYTALQFARKDEAFIKRYLSKPYQAIWRELNGRSVFGVITETKSTYQSISKAKTFTPPSADEAFVFSQVSKNLENACIKARRYKLAATRLIVFIRGQDYRNYGVELRIAPPSAHPYYLIEPLTEGFKKLYKTNILYRQTGVVLSGLVPMTAQATRCLTTW